MTLDSKLQYIKRKYAKNLRHLNDFLINKKAKITDEECRILIQSIINCGIVTFARYVKKKEGKLDLSLLERLAVEPTLPERSDAARVYYAMGEYDHNDAFLERYSVLSGLSKHASVLLFETASAGAVIKRAAYFAQHTPLDAIVFSVHSNMSGLAFGKGYGGEINLYDTGKLRRLGSYVKEGGHIIIDGCEVAMGGKAGVNFATALKDQAPHVTVVAPKKLSYGIKTLKIRRDGAEYEFFAANASRSKSICCI